MHLNPLPYREVKRKLEAVGFVEYHSRGSHVKFVRYAAEGTRTVIIPHHREVSVGTLRSIIRQAGLSAEAFESL